MANTHWRALLLVSLALLSAQTWGGEPLATAAEAATTTKKDAGKIDLMKYMREYLAKFPSGSDVKADQFETVLPRDKEDDLRKLGVTRIANSNDHYTVDLDKQHQKNLRKADLRYGPTLTFTYTEVNGTLTITNVQGIDAKVTFLLGWMQVKNIWVTPDAATRNTSIEVEVHAGFLGNRKHTIVIGPDGKTVATNY
jgi:hypothetical protein